MAPLHYLIDAILNLAGLAVADWPGLAAPDSAAVAVASPAIPASAAQGSCHHSPAAVAGLGRSRSAAPAAVAAPAGRAGGILPEARARGHSDTGYSDIRARFPRPAPRLSRYRGEAWDWPAPSCWSTDHSAGA